MAKKRSWASKALAFAWDIAKLAAKITWAILVFSFRIVVRALKWIFSKAKTAAESRNSRITQSPRPIFTEFEVIEANSGDFDRFQQKLFQSKSSVGLVLGARGSGKTAFGLKVLENAAAKGRKVQALGFSCELLPDWVGIIETVGEVKNGSLALVDEGGINFSSRSSMASANKLLSDLLFISRHKDVSILFITQNSANLDVNAIRQADYLVLKKSSLLQLDFERNKIKEIYEKAIRGFRAHENKPGVSFIYSDEFTGFVSNPLPSFWSEETSKAFKTRALDGKQTKVGKSD